MGQVCVHSLSFGALYGVSKRGFGSPTVIKGTVIEGMSDHSGLLAFLMVLDNSPVFRLRQGLMDACTVLEWFERKG